MPFVFFMHIFVTCSQMKFMELIALASAFGKTPLNDIGLFETIELVHHRVHRRPFCSDGDEWLGYIINNFAVS
jgi:hypothetical protein